MTNLSVKSELEAEVNKLARATTINVLKGVVLATPVDTGRARGNWQVSISKPIESQNSVNDLSGGSTISKGVAKTLAQKKVKYPIFWVVNNLPYIEELNKGSSKQAPVKFVETVIKRVDNGG